MSFGSILLPNPMAVAFEINGQSVIVNDVDPHCTLLQWLRASGRTGTKRGARKGSVVRALSPS